MSYRDAIKRASKSVNNRLGASCTYKKYNGDTLSDISIILDKNKPFKDDFGVIAGYRVEASFLKSEISKVVIQDKFIEPDGTAWRITNLVKDTTAKWYVDVVRS